MYPYRVFLSYAHEDEDISMAQIVADYLTESGCILMWDKSIQPGELFTDKIRDSISFSHVFIPIFTKLSIQHPWVHQEIGFALGMNIPVLPISTTALPVAMIQQTQALIIKANPPDYASHLREKLTAELIENVIYPAGSEPKTDFHAGQVPETRTQLIVDYSKKVSALSKDCDTRIQQLGAFSSFCLPKAPSDSTIWRERDGNIPLRSSYYHDLQRKERLALSELSDRSGCDLIVNPWIKLSKNGCEARKIRLETLKEFLLSSKCKNIRVVCRKKLKPENLLIVGDWFYAHSVTPKPGKGYLQTNFTWHAPSVLYMKREFERNYEEYLNDFCNEFANYFGEVSARDRNSCKASIMILEEIIQSICSK